MTTFPFVMTIGWAVTFFMVLGHYLDTREDYKRMGVINAFLIALICLFWPFFAAYLIFNFIRKLIEK